MSANKHTFSTATIRAVRLAQLAAARGDARKRDRTWSMACDFAWRTGGLSGAANGGNVLMIEHRGRSYVAWAPRVIR